MREVVRGQPRLGVAALQDHRVVAVVVEGQLAADRVGEAHPGARGSRRAEADHVRVAGRQSLGDLLRIGVAPDRPFAVVARQGACRPLPRGHLLQVLLGREARVGTALAQQFSDISQVDLRPRGLGVWPVVAGLVVLVRADGEVLERLGELGRGALDDTGLVGVLQANQVDAAGLPGDIRVDGRRVHAADGQEARRARREAGDLRFFGQVTGRVEPLPVIRLGQVRREQGIDDILAEHERMAPNDVRSRPKSRVPLPQAAVGSSISCMVSGRAQLAGGCSPRFLLQGSARFACEGFPGPLGTRAPYGRALEPGDGLALGGRIRAFFQRQ